MALLFPPELQHYKTNRKLNFTDILVFAVFPGTSPVTLFVMELCQKIRRNLLIQYTFSNEKEVRVLNQVLYTEYVIWILLLNVVAATLFVLVFTLNKHWPLSKYLPALLLTEIFYCLALGKIVSA